MGNEWDKEILFCISYQESINWEGMEVNINKQYLKPIRFTDDILLTSESSDELQELLNDVNQCHELNSTHPVTIWNSP